jgi:hypothetical protein
LGAASETARQKTAKKASTIMDFIFSSLASSDLHFSAASFDNFSLEIFFFKAF